MAMEFSSTLATNRGAQFNATLGSGGTLVIYTGSRPGLANSVTGTLLTTLTSLAYSTSAAVTTITASADTNANASGTPGYGRLLTSGSTAHLEGTAGVGTQATAATPSLSGQAVISCSVTAAGTGYTASDPPVVTVTGGGGYGAVLTASVSAGGVASLSVVNGGAGYASAPTVTIAPPFMFTFSATVSRGGTVTLSSGSISESNYP